MLDFICKVSAQLFGTDRERKIQNENIYLQRGSDPRHASPRQVNLHENVTTERLTFWRQWHLDHQGHPSSPLGWPWPGDIVAQSGIPPVVCSYVLSVQLRSAIYSPSSNKGPGPSAQYIIDIGHLTNNLIWINSDSCIPYALYSCRESNENYRIKMVRSSTLI